MQYLNSIKACSTQIRLENTALKLCMNIERCPMLKIKIIKFNLNPWLKGDVGDSVRVDKEGYIPQIIQIYQM